MRRALSIPLLELADGRDESDLVFGMRRRDPASVGVLFDRYGITAYNLALRILREPESAEAAVAEAMLLCWNRVESFKETRGFALGLVFLLATYANALDRRVGKNASGLAGRWLFQDWAQGIDADRLEETFVALRSLTNEQRTLLELAFFEGLNLVALRERMGCAQGEMDGLIQAALGKLGAG